ncbi:hypothetical protein D9758_002487 [Tetrapyrgos nigripes]|uniref:F-box domain-containing protein n=1 Tax=Tetrapyrgos nigripes TaxID=182062 RepID=A0A8H5LU40_9AGAR|nr:hypothetical protein D9758_002487 [Tetrapyrgos nigripes]
MSINDLPVELLAEVFKFGADLNWPHEDSPFLLKSNSSGADFIYEPDFQVCVSHVCQKWRRVALDLPTLWSTLHFSRPSHIDRAQTFLERCTPSSLPKVFIDDDNPNFDRFRLDILIITVAAEDHIEGHTLAHPQLCHIFNLLCPVTLLWRSLHLRVRDGLCKREARLALRDKCQHASRLQTLQLYHFENFNNAEGLHEATHRTPVVCFANHAPQLKYVSLIGVNLPWDNSPYLKTLHSLELALHLDRIRVPYKVWHQILAESPELKSLRLHYSGPRQPDVEPWGDEEIRLDHLERLSLIDLDSDYLAQILPRLVMPNVKTLELELTTEEPEQDFTSLVQGWANNSGAFIGSRYYHFRLIRVSTRTGLGLVQISNLTCLKLTAIKCDFGPLRDFLHALTALREFELDFDNVCAGEDNRRLEIWKLFVGQDTEDDSIPSSPSPPSSSTHYGLILPKLETFKMFRLPGTQVRDIIRYREGFGREHHRHNQDHHDVNSSLQARGVDDVSHSTTVGTSAATSQQSLPGTLPVNVIPEIKQRSKYIVKYTEQMKGTDAVLDDLVTKGCCWFPEDQDGVEEASVDEVADTNKVIIENGGGSEVLYTEAEIYEDALAGKTANGALLRNLAPEYEARYGSPNSAKWRLVVVDSELVDDAEDEEEEEDDEEEEDGYDEYADDGPTTPAVYGPDDEHQDDLDENDEDEEAT